MSHRHHHHHHHGHHHHHHSHDGHHHHHTHMSRVFLIGIVLNAVFVVVQAGVGIAQGSVALLSDAGHNLGDVASLLISLLAYRLARSRPTRSFTYGYKKTTILAALANAVILLAATTVLGWEAIARLGKPRTLDGDLIATVAGIGIVVNFGSAMLFHKSKDHDLNTKGAYLHLLADAAVSFGVMIAGLLMSWTGWYWLDGAVSLLILLVILYSTWHLLSDSLRMALDAVPHNVHTSAIKDMVLAIDGVEEMHHTHIWAMSTTQNALTTHVTLSDKLTFEEKMQLVRDIKKKLYKHHIQHATIEIHSPHTPCKDGDCNDEETTE